MIKQNQKLFNICNKIVEILIIFLSYFVATYIRFDVMYGDAPALYIAWNSMYITLIGIYAILVVAVYHLSGQFRTSRVSLAFVGRVAKMVFINAIGILLLMAFMYVLKMPDFSRLALFLFFAISTAVLIVKRVAVFFVLNHFRQQGYNLKHVVVVGNGNLAEKYINTVKDNLRFGFRVVGYVSAVEKEHLGASLGSYEELETILEQPGIDEVVVALEAHEMHFMPRIILSAEKQGLKLSIIPTYNDYIPSRPTIELVDEIKLIHVRSTPLDNPLNALIKRSADVVGSLLLIVLTSPLMLFVAIGIKLTSPGPILFKQERVGKDKKPFIMLKFRSMHVNSEEKTGWSRNVDDRKTAFGAFIRKFSLDELPQFINVLRGDMSMIGPRPEIPYHVEHFKEEIPMYLLRQQVRPGISGWAQINGLRGDTSIEERIEYDIWYIENWSFSLDVQICFRTIFGGIINQEKLKVKKK